MQITSNPGQVTNLFGMHTSSSSSSLLGDCIGMESCVDFRTEEEIRVATDEYQRKRDQRLESKKVKIRRVKRELPPPLPCLARTFKKHFTDDGRLVIVEEKVRHHEFFRAQRSNGRLTLDLVMDGCDDVQEEDFIDEDLNDVDDDGFDRTVKVEEVKVEAGKYDGYKSMRSVPSSCYFGMQAVPPTIQLVLFKEFN